MALAEAVRDMFFLQRDGLPEDTEVGSLRGVASCATAPEGILRSCEVFLVLVKRPSMLSLQP